MGFDPTVHHVDVKGKTCYVYEFTPKDPSETLYFRTTKTIFDSRNMCISKRKTRVWGAVEVTGPDGLVQKGGKEVVLKDVSLDKGSQTEKKNQEAIREELGRIKNEKREWLDDPNFRERADNALKNIPDSLPFMRILHDALGMDCKDCSPSAKPDCAILSPPPSPESSGKNVTPLTGQNQSSSRPTGIPQGVQPTLGLVGCPQRQYKVKIQYWLIHAEIGYPLHDVPSIDKAFHAINNVLLGDKISLCAQYCLH